MTQMAMMTSHRLLEPPLLLLCLQATSPGALLCSQKGM
jgi:hypothetical protein